jgi:Mrp family chromosome partitioning ATPase
MEKKSNVELTLVSTTPDFRIIEPAHLTTIEPIIPWAPLTLAVAIVLGLVTGLGLLILIWIFRSGIDNAGDITRFAPTAKLLGEIHYTNIQKPLELRDYPMSPLANQLNGLIYNLGRQYPEYTSVAISSNKPKEGKSFLASMLAMQYAEMGDRVLIIDADLSNRSVAKLLRVKSGTHELNSFSVAELNESIIQTGDSQIDLLQPGKVVFKNAEVASFNGLLEELKKTYDRIIIDTPSIGKDARSLALLNSVVIPIIVVRRRKTDVHDLTDLQRTYASGSLKALNVVMTGGFYARTGWNLRKSSYSKGKKFSLIDRAKLAFVKV